MAEKCTWITFYAHPSQFKEDEDFHPDFFGTFVCPELRTHPEELVHEVLKNQKLALIEIRGKQIKFREDDWGMNERLKKQIDQQGYGMALVKMHPKPIEVD
jgi:hypothetical protein